MYAIKRLHFNAVLCSSCCVGVIAAVLASGIIYRKAASFLEIASAKDISLSVPLRAFPSEIGGWSGTDVPIPETIRLVADNDDFINRLYVNGSRDQWVNIYVAYSARPRTMRGHRPQACFTSAGWVHDRTETASIRSASGREIPCLIHRFYKHGEQNDQIVLLNFYVLNGRCINSERGFSGLEWRSPNIDGKAARYVAQVQISSLFENSIMAAAEEFADVILDYLPDAGGNVGVAVTDSVAMNAVSKGTPR